MTPRELLNVLVRDWFPDNNDVQQLFLEADVRSFLKIFNTSLPGDRVRVVSVEMVSMKVSDEIIGISLVDLTSRLIGRNPNLVESKC